MNFIVSSGTLLKNLQLAGGIISANVVLPILENFLFDLDGSRLNITGSDMETMIKVELEVQPGEEGASGKICLPSKILLEYLKNLPEQPVHFIVNKSDFTVEISSSTGKYKIGGESGDEYPKESEQENTTTIQLPAVLLGEAINKTLFATSNDNLRPAMTGVFFEMNPEEGITFVATDAHRLVKLTRKDVTCPEEGSIIVPKKPLQQLKNMIPADESLLDISFNETHLFIQSENIKLNCRLIEGKYPPYKAVIPEDNPFEMLVSRNELISCLRRVSIFANKSTSQVVFDIVGNAVNISAQDVDFSYEGKETLPCQFSGEDMKIAFNARMLIEILNNLEGDEVKLELSLPSRAGIFRPTDPVEQEDLLMLLMPLMVGV